MPTSAPPSDVTASVQLAQLLMGHWAAQAIATVARLGLAEALAEGPRHPESLAAEHSLRPESLRRLLRSLTPFGIFSAESDGRYGLGPLGQSLRRDAPGSLHHFAQWISEPSHSAAWSRLDLALAGANSAFQHTHGCDLWAHLAADPQAAAIFNGAMTDISGVTVPPLLEAFDFGAFSTLVDVGGGHGAFLKSILAMHPNLKGILFDDPSVVATCSTEDFEGRLELRGGNFFEAVPRGADAYLLKAVLHDWDDAQCVHLLSNIRASMAPQGRLLVAEMVLPEDGSPHPGLLVDLELLCVTEGGAERTRAEYAELLERAGFRLEAVHATEGFLNLIEATPA